MNLESRIFEWSYKPTTSNNDNYYGTQKDWNQTIIVKFNQMIDNDDYDPDTCYFIVPRIYESILNSMEFYKEEEQVLWSFDRPDKKITFTDEESIEDIVLVKRDEIEALGLLKINDFFNGN